MGALTMKAMRRRLHCAGPKNATAAVVMRSVYEGLDGLPGALFHANPIRPLSVRTDSHTTTLRIDFAKAPRLPEAAESELCQSSHTSD